MSYLDSGEEPRVCLLTGAGGRLGNEFCTLFAGSFDVAAVTRRRVPAVSDQHRGYFDPCAGTDVPTVEPEIFTIEADLEDPTSCERIVELTLARFGRIDLLVNAAADVRYERLTTAATDPSALSRAFAVNAVAPMQLAATVARQFWDGRFRENQVYNRNVVNISSGAGVGHTGVPGLAAYSASKAALNFLTRFLADEFRGFGVRVNAVAPTTFPQLIATSEVAKEIVRLDGSRENGEIISLG
jgi:NAD(P)-dependent dehydrogenase (short-subunit alcohol dehydrogenase family)